MSVLQVVPGLRLAAPRDGARFRALFREAIEVDDAPTVVRVPKGALPADVEAIETVGGCDVLARTGDRDVLIVSVGAMASTCVDVAARLDAQGIGVTVVDPRWVKPVNERLVALAAEHRLVVTVEDNSRVGGCGAALAQTVRDSGIDVPVETLGLPQRFLEHGRRDDILDAVGLSAQAIAREITAKVVAAIPADDPAPQHNESG
jgi:1-deoxy-D-xylulose-5-phosphate synthase